MSDLNKCALSDLKASIERYRLSPSSISGFLTDVTWPKSPILYITSSPSWSDPSSEVSWQAILQKKIKETNLVDPLDRRMAVFPHFFGTLLRKMLPLFMSIWHKSFEWIYFRPPAMCVSSVRSSDSLRYRVSSTCCKLPPLQYSFCISIWLSSAQAE